MTQIKLEFVQEPPTKSEFDNLINENKAASELLSGFNRGRQTEWIDHELRNNLRRLKNFLEAYEGGYREDESALLRRMHMLQLAEATCEDILRNLVVSLRSAQAKNRIEGSRSEQQHIAISELVFEVKQVCSAKYHQLKNLRYYITDDNLERMLLEWRPVRSEAANELRSMTKQHFAEYLSGFNVTMHGKGHFKELHLEWQDAIIERDLKAAEGIKINVPCYPVFIEGKTRIPFREKYQLEFFKSHIVTYDGTGKASPFHVERVGDQLIQNIFDGTSEIKRKLDTEGNDFAFIIDAKENIYVYEHIMGRQHHSSATAGRAVLGAGKLIASEGKVTFINDHSGHYAPTPRHMLNAIKVFHTHNLFSSPNTIVSIKNFLYEEAPPFEFYSATLINASNAGLTVESLVAAMAPPWSSVEIAQQLMPAFTDPDWESDYYSEQDGLYDNIKNMVTDRPRSNPTLFTATRARGKAFNDGVFMPRTRRSNAVTTAPVRTRRRSGAIAKALLPLPLLLPKT